jgi:hypothetical protein
MAVETLLRQAGITAMTYQTLVRNVSFMGRRKKGQGDLPREQLLALKAFALLRAHGLRASVAASTVERAFPTICTFANAGKPPSGGAYKLGARLVSIRGRLRAIPIQDSAPRGAYEVGLIELDLRGVEALLPGERRGLEQTSILR